MQSINCRSLANALWECCSHSSLCCRAPAAHALHVTTSKWCSRKAQCLVMLHTLAWHALSDLPHHPCQTNLPTTHVTCTSPAHAITMYVPRTHSVRKHRNATSGTTQKMRAETPCETSLLLAAGQGPTAQHHTAQHQQVTALADAAA